MKQSDSSQVYATRLLDISTMTKLLIESIGSDIVCMYEQFPLQNCYDGQWVHGMREGQGTFHYARSVERVFIMRTCTCIYRK